MTLTVLNSNSSGNGYILTSSTGESLLIESGVRLLEVKKALDFDMTGIAGLILSHQHNDHAGHLIEYLFQGIDCYMSAETAEGKQCSQNNAHIIKAKQTYQVGSYRIKPFEVVHDCMCYGYLIFHPEMGLTVFVTDTHFCPFTFPGLNQILIEANYSDDIVDARLLAGTANTFVRNRVLTSHMEFETTKGFLKANDLSNVTNIILIHLSDGNSDANLFKKEITGLTGKQVYIATKGLKVPFNKQTF
jgi:phosphoribosyl 1,2-cyclic phosphodiesterase